MTEPIQVLIADDHPLFRDGLRVMLEAADGFEIVGEATSGEEAVALALSLRPNVVLMDINMPGVNGIEATRRIVAADPQAQVLMLTMLEDDDSVFAALRAGARGYLLKGARRDEALRAIRAVANGEAIFGPVIAQRMTQLFRRAPSSLRRGAVPGSDRSRAGDPRPDCPGAQQRADRRRSGGQPQDRAQPRLHHLQQAASG